jgi:chromosome segregation ATPase
MGRLQEEKDSEVSRLESEIKQTKFAAENHKLDYETCEKKFKDAEKFLKNEVLKNKRLSEELFQTKDKLSQMESKVKSQNQGLDDIVSPKAPLTPTYKDRPPQRFLHNPLKSSNPAIARTSSNTEVVLSKDSGKTQELMEASEITILKKTIAALEKTLKQLESEKSVLESKLGTAENFVSRRDAELFEMKKSIEEKADLIATFQDENKSLFNKAKVLKEKRDLGLKEIQKLRDKIETLKAQHTLNESLNTSFSMGGLNDSFNLSSHDKAQVSDLLHL